MKIKNIQLHGNVILAPMAEYTNLPFRILAKESGAAMVYTEMAMAKSIAKGDRKELHLFRTKPSEKPAAAQICGRDPNEMAEASKTVESLGFSAVDINLCCPINRIVNQKAGAALMAEPEQVQRIVDAVVKAVTIPVTAKILSGIASDKINAVHIAKICEEVGCSAIAIQPRTAEQGYLGEADWNLIKDVKQAVQIPVIGSGDIRTPSDVKRMLETTGCDGVMAARGCLGRPWFFRQASHLLSTGSLLPRPSISQIKQIMHRHFQLLQGQNREETAVLLLRRHLPYYAREMGKEKDFGKAVRNIRTAKEFESAVKEWL